MNLITGHDNVCKKIAEALGIKHCTSLDLRIRTDEIVSVKVEFYPEVDGLKSMVPILKEYRLIAKKEQTKCQE